MPNEVTDQTQPRNTSSQTETLLQNLDSLSDDEFFQRLTSLRTEHKRTLMHYEQLYHEKLMAETGGDVGMIFGQPLFSATGARQSADGSERPKPTGALCVNGVAMTLRSPSPAGASPSPPKNSGPSAEEKENFHPILLDQILQAPKLETFGRDYNLSLQEPVNTGGDTFNHNLEIIRRSTDKPPRSPCPVHKCREAWTTFPERAGNDSSGDEADYANYDETRYQKSKDAALDRIEGMWDDFRLSDYQEGKSSDRRRSEEWRHRITMPQPFRMTLREENKAKQKSRSLAEYEHQKAMKDMEERFECEKKFRAAPVPAHVYLPLYEEILEKAETKRRTNVQVAKELLKLKEKPFEFNERRRKIPDHGRRHSAPVVKHKQFKAKPIPKAVLDDVSERLLEEEEYRKIRIRMRSREMLRSASLPPRMASREQYTVGKLKEKLREGKEKKQKLKDNKFQPKITKKVPDFDTIHRKQQKEVANRCKNRDPQIATVCEPFKFHSTTKPYSIDKVLKDIEKDEEELLENRWPYKNPRAKPKLGEVRRSYDALPSYSTNAHDLRQSKNYEDLSKKSNKELQDEKNRERQADMARKICEKARANDNSKSLKATNAERLRAFREEERMRLEDYKKELAAMQTRVSRQPFLFERQSQINARKRAEKRFEEALRDAGVDEESLSSLTRHSRGPRAPEDMANLTDDDADEIPTRDYPNATYDATTKVGFEEDHHYSHSFVADEDDDDVTNTDSAVEQLEA